MQKDTDKKVFDKKWGNIDMFPINKKFQQELSLIRKRKCMGEEINVQEEIESLIKKYASLQ